MAIIHTGKPESADLAELRVRTKAGTPRGHYYVALLGLRNYEPLRIAATVLKGLAYSSLLRLHRNSTLSAATIAESAQITPRTLARRKMSGKLEPDESDRLVRVSRIVGRALELFEGDTTAARVWLLGSQTGLGGAVPLELAKTDVGAREVENLIGRLEHGIPT
ncbi:MAG TPA: antitoxin Xre/MbcA/ParS toxin-binding domain-containing protein [Gemmatimonadaceae bacterium]|nr:antitoxin Xre/MbcA/ParS toxin-binding domain-containing protein [Gemmatimonadaceae bacterium]